MRMQRYKILNKLHGKKIEKYLEGKAVYLFIKESNLILKQTRNVCH